MGRLWLIWAKFGCKFRVFPVPACAGSADLAELKSLATEVEYTPDGSSPVRKGPRVGLSLKFSVWNLIAGEL